MGALDGDGNRRAPPEVGPADDESFLDDLYERALACFESGEAFDATSWIAERGHLGAAIESAVRLARDVAESTAPRRPPAPPRVAGYVLEGELGHGATGAVYLARQEALGGRRVALKVLAAPAAFSARGRQRFLREARALAKVRHAHVVPVHDVIDSGGVCAYAMEWIEGASLERVLRALASTTPTERLRVAGEVLGSAGPLEAESWPLFVVRAGRDLARALAAVHAAGLLHRDVKPANVLLRSDGLALLTDFSLVRDPEDELVTRTGQFVGTPAYAAPEQLRGDGRSVDARSDLYGLAATLFEALTLCRPFSGRTGAELLARIESGTAPRLREHDPRLSRDLETILAKCLEADPARRYATAEELADDLERLLRLEPIRARPAGLLERAQKTLQRERKRWIAGLVGAALVLGPALWASVRFTAWLRRDEHAAELRRQAQLALLNPTVDNALWFAAFEPGLGRRPVPPLEHSRARAEGARELYSKALSLGPHPEVTRELATELSVVELAYDLLEGRPASPDSELASACPVTSRFALAFAAGTDPSWNPDEVAHASLEDRRMLGLLAFLLEQGDLAIHAWREASLGYPPDPLADGALGQVHLARGEWELAYPRLLAAYAAFPEAGFLCARLAEASLRIGRLEQTERLLERAERLELHDTFESVLRVRAGLLAAQGKDQEARLLYEGLIQRRQGSGHFIDYARFLEARGEAQLGLEVRRHYAQLRPGSILAQAQFLSAAGHWWSREGRNSWELLEQGLLAPEAVQQFASALASILLAERDRRSLDPQGAYVLPDSALPPTAISASTTDEGTSLLGLVRRMETLQMDPERLIRLHPVVRSLLARSLGSAASWPSRIVWGAIVGMGLGYGPTTASAQVLSEQKVSETAGGFIGALGATDHFGSSIAALGDLDGDGIGDLAIGVPSNDTGGTDQGAVWILFLNADGTVASEQKIAEGVGGFGGVLQPGDIFGISVAGLGDLDGDGAVDLAVGAMQDDTGGTDQGAVWILFLNPDGTVASHQKIAEGLGGFGGVLDPVDFFGAEVAALGDFDGDGVMDLAAGAYRDDDGGTNQGAFWILFLNSDGTVASHQKISETAGGFQGVLDSSDFFGVAIVDLGDVDGDGVHDLAVSAPDDDDGGSNQGAVWVLFMNANGTVASHQKISETTGGFAGPLAALDEFGVSVASLGDINSDGIGDLAVGCHRDDHGGMDQGAVWVLFLNANGTVASHQKIAEGLGGFGGVLDPGDGFGVAVAGVGDLDGDGIGDLAVGAYQDDDGGTDKGTVWILFLDCLTEATVTTRSAGLNPTSYTATPAVLGSAVTATVDLTTTGHPFARLMTSLVPRERAFTSGYVLLVGGPRTGMVSGMPGGPLTTGVPGPLATFSIPIPNDPALCGRRFYTQAVHFGGGLPFALSNSQDFVIGR